MIPQEAELILEKKSVKYYRKENGGIFKIMEYSLMSEEINDFINKLGPRSREWLLEHNYEVIEDYSGSAQLNVVEGYLRGNITKLWLHLAPHYCAKILLGSNNNGERLIITRTSTQAAMFVEREEPSIMEGHHEKVWVMQDGHQYWGSIPKVCNELKDRFTFCDRI